MGLWRRAFWVPGGVRRSKCEQHLYRCCVIFIALLHLLGGISFSVNNQVNCTQTLSGTPANFFIVTLTQAFPPPPTQSQKTPSLSLIHLNPWVQLHPKTLPASMTEGFMVPRRESGRVVCSNGFTSQEVAMLSYIPQRLHRRARKPFWSTSRQQSSQPMTTAETDLKNNLQPDKKNTQHGFSLNNSGWVSG